ncbi:MAG: Tripartite-type tricarboxylate transporter, receptor component TctC [Hyphomicrobiales bacterium]|nr:Tripartite-type tricarboxylate transporter, receptor component TctC [Hyphomicrobiales bacterium]
MIFPTLFRAARQSHLAASLRGAQRPGDAGAASPLRLASLSAPINGNGRALIFASMMLATALPAQADPVEDFYKGRNINLIIGLGEGGGYDLSARLVAQHLSNFIPGKPTVVPRNMPGAGSIAAAEYVYSIAPRDGTTIALFQPTFVLEKITDRARKFESEKFGYLGRVDQSVLVGLVWKNAPARTIEDIKKREIVLSANAAAGTSATIPWALNRLIGTKFKVVLGYASSATMGLALERGEADGIGSTSWDYLQTRQDWFDEKKIDILYTIALSRYRELPDVPTVLELTNVEKDRNVLKLMASTSSIGRAFLTTPEVPPERLAALRQAFDRMTKDPAFLADAAKRHLGVDPLSGVELQALVTDVATQPAEVVEAMKAAVLPPGKE